MNNTFKFKPEGWNDEVVDLDHEKINEYMKSKGILQGLVKACDEQYNLHVSLGNGIAGIIPMEEVEGINIEQNGLPKTNLCTGKVHKFVQFKIKEKDERNMIILSRKDVQEEVLNWVKNGLKVGQKVTRNS